jgi:hypothetical protein
MTTTTIGVGVGLDSASSGETLKPPGRDIHAVAVTVNSRKQRIRSHSLFREGEVLLSPSERSFNFHTSHDFANTALSSF